MNKYLKRSTNITKHTITALTVTTPVQSSKMQTHSDKHRCKFHNTSDQVNEILGQTCASKNTKLEPVDIKDPHDSDGLHSS